MSESSHELYERQVKYDRLHHLMRLEWLRPIEKPSWFERSLLKQSERAVAPGGHHESYNSVDLDDHEYIAELDAFEASGKASP